MVIPRPSVLSVRKPAKSLMLSAQLYVVKDTHPLYIILFGVLFL